MKTTSIIRLILILIAILFTLYDTAQAGGNSLTFTVTCTVPSIAGMNTPLIEKEEVRPGDTSKNTQTEINVQEALKGQKPMILQEDKEQNMRLPQGAMLPLVTKTFYSR